MSEKKIELIAQMLAKAESTTPEEAEALTEAAEKLMIKYGIEQALVDHKRSKAGESSEKIITVKVQFNGAYRLDTLSLGVSVLSALGNLRGLQSTYSNKIAWLHIIGFESDVARAELLIRSLEIQGLAAVRTWWKANKSEHATLSQYDQEATRRSFMRGFGTGAARRIRDNRQQTITEAGTSTELVLVSRDAKVQTYLDGLSTSPNRARGGKSSPDAAGHGYLAGQKADTGEKSLGHTKQVGA